MKFCQRCAEQIADGARIHLCAKCRRYKERHGKQRPAVDELPAGRRPHKYTARLDDVQDWIVDYMMGNGYPPTQREICEKFDAAQGTISSWLSEMQADGLVEVERYTPRGIRVPGVYYVDERNA